MADYVRVEDGRIVDGPGPCPKVYAHINGFDRLPQQELAVHGWFPFHGDAEPEFDTRSYKSVRTLLFGSLVRSAVTVEPLSPNEVQLNFVAQRDRMLERNAELRWIAETSPLDFLGIPIHMNRDSQITIFAAALRGQGETWKAADGNWYEITAEQLVELSEASAQHKRAMFGKEATIASQIKAAMDFADLDAIDLEALWTASISE
jgi:hypothetical protein